MKNKNNKLLLCLLGLGMALSACKKDKPTVTSVASGVYVAGHIYNSAKDIYTACYWKNGEFLALGNSTTNSRTNDILIFQNAVYISGDQDGKPCYWKNGKLIDLSENGTYTGTVVAMSFKDNILLLVGKVKTANFYQAAVWMIDGNNSAQKKFVSANESEANDVAFVASEAYIAGAENSKPVYWKFSNKAVNSTSNPLSLLDQNNINYGTGVAKLVSVFNGQPYFWGICDGTSGFWDLATSKYSYLFDKAATNLISCKGGGFDSNGMLYIVGGDLGNALVIKINVTNIYFEDSVNLDVQPVVAYKTANGIAIHEADVYIAGENTTNNTACYWKNGVFVNLETPNSFTSSIWYQH